MDASSMPGPWFEAWEWMDLAACASADPAIFFIPSTARGSTRYDLEAAGKALCAACPVLARCRQQAGAEAFGTWGGLSEGERDLRIAPTPGRKVPKRRPRSSSPPSGS